MTYSLTTVFAYKYILLIILLFFLVFFIYQNVNVFKEGFNLNTPEARSEENRFKLDATPDDIIEPKNALLIIQSKLSKFQSEVDNFLDRQTYEPVNNDDDVKKAFKIIYDKYNNQFSSVFSKLYYLSSVVPIFFKPFIYDKNSLACQYNALLKCYPKTIKNGDDYRAMYTIIILAEIAGDLTNSELDPASKYYGYITDPVLVEIKTQLDYFYNKL